MQRLVAPLLIEHQGELVKFEADNAYAVFSDSRHAVHCALQIHQRLQELNNGVPDVDDVVVSIGLARGRILWIPGHDFFGDAVNLASKLGEDIADHGETLVSTDLFDEIQSDPSLQLDPLEINLSGFTLTAAKVTRL